MKIGYTRVSTKEQEAGYLDQIEKLKDAGCKRIFEEKISGTQAENRPELQKALEFIREGDILVGTKIDRIGRSLLDLLNIEKQLTERGAFIQVLNYGLDTTTPVGKMVFQIFGAIAEWEVADMKDRQRIGIDKAKAEGKYKNHPKGRRRLKSGALSKPGKPIAEYVPGVIKYARMVRADGSPLYSYVKIAEFVGCGITSVKTILADAGITRSRAPADLAAEVAK